MYYQKKNLLINGIFICLYHTDMKFDVTCEGLFTEFYSL